MSDGIVDKPQQKFSGKILNFNLGGVERKHITGVIKYGEFRKYVASNPFDSKTGEGEQRNVIERHANQIKKAMKAGDFSPTVFTVGTYKTHRDNIQYNDTGKHATLFLDENDKLPVLDGGNRMFALDKIRDEGGTTTRLVDDIYIPYILYLDGDTKKDFINLQAGKPVSRDHILSVRIVNGLMDEKHGPFMKLAKEAAEILHDRNDSFCKNLIQFDSRGAKLPLSLNTLCNKAGSDLAFSLVGGAKIALQYEKDATWLAHCILEAYRAIKKDDDAFRILESGSILCPVPQGTKAGTTLLIGLGNALASRLLLTQQDEPTEKDLSLLIDCAVDNLDEETKGNTSADRKRKLFNSFCVNFFKDLDIEEIEKSEELDEDEVPKNRFGFHEGIPVILIELLSPSTFGVSKIPSQAKRGRKPKAVVASAIVSDEDSDNEDEEITVETSPDDPDFEEEDKLAEENIVKLEAENEELEEAPWEEDGDNEF